MDHDHYPDSTLRDILARTRRIALVGASPDPSRASHSVMQFLLGRGYDVIPVNPTVAGQQILGRTVLASLAEVPQPIDLVDVFRNSAAAGGVADEAIAAGAKFVWMQLGVRHDEGAARAEAAGLKVVMDRCPRVEYPRLFGDKTVAEIAA